MGTWGEGPFDNDDAADFVGDLIEVDVADDALVVLDRALRAVTTEAEYLESPTATEGIAAASVVAISAGAPADDERVPTWIAAIGLRPDNELRSQARRTFERVAEPRNNEWHELWVESGLLDDVLARFAPYRAAL